ncbi:tyrosine-type recombinase/integrase [Epibacterium ulvae]|uniref:tyrosine-type recombinase/integrase n=1 Tax=Epibacterium ulvae TaxID=1156985 RepID=UPI00248F650C|nr:tyrosine-type recombinase/integrase [Epibacterium ulvae]
MDLETRTWTREVKAKEEIKTVTHPLSDAAVALIVTLPGFRNRRPGKLVFPNRAGGVLGNWDRAYDVIKAQSETKDWHRHDLRRSAATILSKFGVSEAIVDTLLSHNNAFSSGNTSAAASAYILLSTQMNGLPDPLRDAVNLLAAILQKLENREIG